MRILVSMIAAMVLAATLGHAQSSESGLISLETGQDSRGWEAVGRLDIAGKGFCTGALISERLILTAAHCIYGQDGRKLDPSDFTFLAGLRAGRAEATRGIRSFVAHPDYVHEGSSAHADAIAVDIAVLELDRPIRQTGIQPFDIAARPREGDEIGIVSYGRGRAEAASLQKVCAVLGQQRGMVVMNCDVDFGSSGSPVFSFASGEPRIVSVVSAMAQFGESDVSLGTSLQEPLWRLLRHFESIGPANPGGTQRLIASGQRNDTGAKFVRP